MIKKVCGIVVCAFILMSFNVFAETFDRIVAVVNDEPITQSELDRLLIPIYEQYRNAYTGSEFMTKIGAARSSLLSQMIEDKLVYQEAKRLGLEIDAGEIENKLKDIQAKFTDKVEFENYLQSQGITIDKLREKFEEQILIRKMHQYEVSQKVVVSPNAIEKYYNEHKDDFTESQKTKIRTIMVKKNIDDESGVDVSAETIKRIVEEIKAGAVFAEQAQKYSDESHASEGGDLGFIKRGQLIPLFDDVVFSLDIGEISSVIESELGYHVFLVEAKQEEKVKELSVVKDQIFSILYKEQAKERFDNWLKELKGNAYISIK